MPCATDMGVSQNNGYLLGPPEQKNDLCISGFILASFIYGNSILQRKLESDPPRPTVQADLPEEEALKKQRVSAYLETDAGSVSNQG